MSIIALITTAINIIIVSISIGIDELLVVVIDLINWKSFSEDEKDNYYNSNSNNNITFKNKSKNNLKFVYFFFFLSIWIFWTKQKNSI